MHTKIGTSAEVTKHVPVTIVAQHTGAPRDICETPFGVKRSLNDYIFRGTTTSHRCLEDTPFSASPLNFEMIGHARCTARGAIAFNTVESPVKPRVAVITGLRWKSRTETGTAGNGASGKTWKINYATSFERDTAAVNVRGVQY